MRPTDSSETVTLLVPNGPEVQGSNLGEKFHVFRLFGDRSCATGVNIPVSSPLGFLFFARVECVESLFDFRTDLDVESLEVKRRTKMKLKTSESVSKNCCV